MTNRIIWLAAAILAGLLVGTGCGGDAVPATGGGAGDDSVPFENPLLGTKVGEWAEYRRTETLTERLTALSTNPATHALTIKREIRDTELNALRGNPVLELPPNQFLFGFARAGGIVVRLHREPIELLGRTFDALCVETVGQMQGNIKSWYSNDVPVFGLLRQVRVKQDGTDVLYELLDHSRK